MSQVNDDNKKQHENFIQNEFPVLIEMLNKHLDFKRWGFKLTHTGILPQHMPYIVYQSNQCKVRFRWEQDRPYEEPLIYVNYGRIHAPLDNHVMVWNGEICRCWHSIELILNFLAGLLPSDIDNEEFKVPHVLNTFYESNKDKRWTQLEFTARKHAYIWEYYGQRLFELFDVRRPDLWEAYADFLREYYKHKDEQNKLKGIRLIPVNPPLHKVC